MNKNIKIKFILKLSSSLHCLMLERVVIDTHPTPLLSICNMVSERDAKNRFVKRSWLNNININYIDKNNLNLITPRQFKVMKSFPFFLQMRYR